MNEKEIKISTLADLKVRLLDKKLEGDIIPDVIFEIIQDLKNYYEKS